MKRSREQSTKGLLLQACLLGLCVTQCLIISALCVYQFHSDNNAEEPGGPVQATGEVRGC